MGRSFCGAILIIGALGSSSSSYAANECDPAQFLKYEDVKESRDIATQLFFLDSLNKEHKQKDEFQGSFGYGTMGINHDGVRDVADRLSTQLKIDYSNTEKTWYTISKLSETGKEAYVECVKNNKKNFSVVFSNDATKKDEFFLVINSHPTWDAPNPQPIQIKVIHGKVLDAPKSVRNQQKALAQIRRDLNAATDISVQVGPDISLVTLPPKSNRLVFETRTTDPVLDEVYGGNDDKQHLLCIALKNDEQDVTILPKSLKVLTAASIANKGIIRELDPAQNRIDSDPRKACTLIYWHLSDSGGRIRGTAQISVNIARAIPDNAPVTNPTNPEPHKRPSKR